MRTYEDLLACGEDEEKRLHFILSAITDHKGSARYKTALDAKLYYSGENPTIAKYEKILYDMQGMAQKDMYSANHKIASRFFGFVVDQAVSYLLGNGVSFSDGKTKKKLGPGFDQKVSLCAQYAMTGGEAYGFWDLDHVEVFEVTKFVPLYGEQNGVLMAGIRFWQLDKTKPLYVTLYEPDGFSQYRQEKDWKLKLWKKKRGYKKKFIVRKIFDMILGYEPLGEENYDSFPIVPLKNNRDGKSELCGRQTAIDALDLACSNMVNNVDEGNLIYWALINCGGMDYEDAARFLEHVRRTKVAFIDNGEEGATAEPHAIEAPFEGTQATIDMLEKKLYQDFQAFDASAVTAGNQTATAIKASYVPLDLKTDKFERQVTDFILGILSLAGIADEPTYTRSRIINTQEEIQSVLLIAPYVTREYLVRKLLTILGDADMVEDILDELEGEALGRFQNGGDG